MSLLPQNLSRSCSTEEIGPRHSDFLEKLQKTPVLVGISLTPAGGLHAASTLAPHRCPVPRGGGGEDACTGRFLRPALLVTRLLSSLSQNCSIAVCQKIQCDIPSFGIQEELKVTLKGNLSFDWYIKVRGGA